MHVFKKTDLSRVCIVVGSVYSFFSRTLKHSTPGKLKSPLILLKQLCHLQFEDSNEAGTLWTKNQRHAVFFSGDLSYTYWYCSSSNAERF
jgi:hypothetical protein